MIERCWLQRTVNKHPLQMNESVVGQLRVCAEPAEIVSKWYIVFSDAIRRLCVHDEIVDFEMV